MDTFINDDENVEERDRKEPIYSDFRALTCSLEEFYREVYVIPEAPKRKPEKFEISEEERQSIMKKVKTNKAREEEEKERKL